MANTSSDRSQNPQGRESEVKDTQQSNQGAGNQPSKPGSKTNVQPGEKGSQESTKGGDQSHSGSNR